MSDYIKREDAIKIINSGISIDTYADKRYVNGLFRAIRPADVALVKHGRWYKNDQDKLLMRIRCSICNKAIYSENHFAYCPNCGARMDAKE